VPTPYILDLSHHNQVRDLQFAVDAGIGAVIVKVSQGVGGHDQAYPKHAAKVKAAGLRLGAYHFGSGSHGGADQAKYHLDTLDADGGIPQVLVLDVENNPGGTTITLPQAEDFVNTVHARHPAATVVLYGGSLLREMKIHKDSVLLSCPLWLASYTVKPTVVPPWPGWHLWQYTDKAGKFPGMPDSLDGYDLSDTIDGVETLKHLWNES